MIEWIRSVDKSGRECENTFNGERELH